MWYPSQEQLQQHSWYKYVQYTSSQQLEQQTYTRRSYYCNDDELSSTCVGYGNSENDSFNHPQSTYRHNKHVSTHSDNSVITSNKLYVDEMSSYQTTATQKPTWNSAIVAPTKPMNVLSSSSSSSSCWNWVLFSPKSYSNIYQPSTNFQNNDENHQDFDWHFLACLPTCLLALLYLTPKLMSTDEQTIDEDEHDQEIKSLNYSNDQQSKRNRSATPDTDDGYQSASDASRSDCSQPSSLPSDDHHLNEHSLSNPLTPRRLSYAAAAKPIPPATNKFSSYPTSIGKSKQILNSTLTSTLSTNDGQKLKFIAPRFERMHHAKQHSSSSSSSSNRTQLRTNNHDQRNFTTNSTRRR